MGCTLFDPTKMKKGGVKPWMKITLSWVIRDMRMGNVTREWGIIVAAYTATTRKGSCCGDHYLRN